MGKSAAEKYQERERLKDEVEQYLRAKADGLDWVEIVIHVEIAGDFEMENADAISFVVYRAGDQYAKQSISLDFELESLIKLRESFSYFQEAWTAVEIHIERVGHSFQYSYEDPKRLKGVFDKESKGRFDEYLKKFQ